MTIWIEGHEKEDLEMHLAASMKAELLNPHLQAHRSHGDREVSTGHESERIRR